MGAPSGIQAAHLAYGAGLAARGPTTANGPLTDQSEDGFRGMSVYTVGPEEALRLAQQDPSVRAGRLRSVVARWWTAADRVASLGTTGRWASGGRWPTLGERPAAVVCSVNVGAPQPNPYESAPTTGFGKRPHCGPVEVRAPGPKHGGLGSGLVGDFVGDQRHHGGDEQAVYAFAREDLDRWEQRLGRPLPDGAFGENLTTSGINLIACVLGERWRLGSEVELVVTSPRIPCATFRGFLGVRGWLKTFTADANPGLYLSVARPGSLAAGDPIEVLHQPTHGVTVGLAFRALTTDPALLAEVMAAGDDLPSDLRRSRRTAGG